MIEEKYYSIHGLLNFKIIFKKNSFINRKFDMIKIAYNNFQTETLDSLDFVIEIGRFRPNLEGCCINDDKFFVKKDYFYCKDHYKFAAWEIELSKMSTNFTIKLSTNLIGGLFIHGLIGSIIHYKMNEKGFPIIHSSCVCNDGKAFLFAARSGGGKTTLALYLIKKGYKYLSDNFTIINNGKAYSYLTPLAIFDYNLMPIVRENLTDNEKMAMKFKSIIYKITNEYIKLFTNINPKKIFKEKIIDISNIKTIFVLIPKNNFATENIKKEKVIEHLCYNMMLDYFPFIGYLMEYSYTFPESNFNRHWNSYRDNLKKNISDDITLYKIDVPLKFTPLAFEKITKMLEE